jgi:hypothetical protein
VEAIRQDAGWQATLAGREVAGQMSWAPEGDGKLAARLSKFVLPPVTTEIQADKPDGGAEQRLPSVDLVAESFTYEGKNLGRLTVLARPQTSGWQLQRLEIANPESKFAMNGSWAIGQTSRTDVKVKLDVSDVAAAVADRGLQIPLASEGVRRRQNSAQLRLQTEVRKRCGIVARILDEAVDLAVGLQESADVRRGAVLLVADVGPADAERDSKLIFDLFGPDRDRARQEEARGRA